MRRKRHRRHRGRSRTPRVAESVAGYTRPLALNQSVTGPGTSLTTIDVPDVLTPAEHTENRKLIRVGGTCMFAAGMPANRAVMAQFCLWAHPKQESWPSVTDYDPFTEGPGETGFEGMLAPRAFCRRTFVLVTPSSGVTETITEQHMIRSKAQRLLRPGWILSAGLYVRGDSGVAVAWRGLLRFVVAG